MHSQTGERIDLSPFADLRARLALRTANIGIIGLGYVGLPLAIAIAQSGLHVTGFDIDGAHVDAINLVEPGIGSVAPQHLQQLINAKRLIASADFTRLGNCDVLCICVPTPLTPARKPDLSFVEATMRDIAKCLRKGQLIILESTTYPGTTEEIVRPILESSGLYSRQDFLLAYSPEREDPGNPNFTTGQIPKLVSGDGVEALDLAEMFYLSVFDQIVRLSSPGAAELTKIFENIFRATNIALVNEMKLLAEAMGIDIWEVIAAASTKPFGFMPFFPGPGLGGHCIPVDPFYLSWRAEQLGLSARFVELAGEINSAMPDHIVHRLESALQQRLGKELDQARILLIGIAYKPDIGDIRGAPALTILSCLHERGADVTYHDPHVPIIGPTRDHPRLEGIRSQPLEAEIDLDAVLIITDHGRLDYQLIANLAPILIDTRNVMQRLGIENSSIIKA